MTNALYVINSLDGMRASQNGFASKVEAKIVRDSLIKEGKRVVVSRGPDHPLGASIVDSGCLRTEQTSAKQARKKASKDARFASTGFTRVQRKHYPK